MGLIELYHRLPIPLQEIGLSLYGLRLRWARYGYGLEGEVDRLQKSAALSGGEIARARNSLLKETMHHAAKNVAFYRDLNLPLPTCPDEAPLVLQEWPILEKSVVQQRGREFVEDSAVKGRLHEIHTGGTTGRPLAIFATSRDLQRNYSYFERLKRSAGLSSTSRVATFAGRAILSPSQKVPPYWRRNFSSRQLLLSSYHISERTCDSYITALEEYSPDFIDSYPSSLEPIARRILERGGTSLKLKAVITSSESLHDSVRVVIESAFGCPVFDHYGSAEMVAFVSQCAGGSYHVNEDFGYLEIIGENGKRVADGEEGEIVATGFVNHTMPLIRYRMGDLAIRGSKPCHCGQGFECLTHILGRVDDVIITPDGRRIGRIDPIFKAVRTIREARIIQEQLDRLHVEVVVEDSFGIEEEVELLRQLRLRVGEGIGISMSRVNAIPRTARGKLKMVESRLSKADPTVA